MYGIEHKYIDQLINMQCGRSVDLVFYFPASIHDTNFLFMSVFISSIIEAGE